LDFYILYTLLPFFISLSLSAVLVKLAPNGKRFLDKPNHRKIHNKKIPRNGGISMFVTILLVWVVSQVIGKPLFSYKILISINLIFFLGLIDDAVELNFKIKFLVQIVAATICVIDGFVIEILPNFPGKVNIPILNIFLTYVWIIGITNALNLIDGIDGLASSVTISSSLLIFAKFGDPLSLVLAFTCIGFFIFNWNPAKIFMGDSGSNFLGFLLSLIVLKNFTDSEGTWLIGMGVFLGYPVLDTFYAFIRRLLQRKNPFEADQQHFHHQLLTKGLSQKMVLLNLATLSLLFNLFGLLLYKSGVILFLLYILLSGFFYFYVRNFPIDIKRSL